MNTIKSPRDRLVAARKALILDHPFYGALALRLTLQEEKHGRTETLGTDGRCIYYDRDFVNGSSDAELMGLLAHEVMHPALQHHTRRGQRDLRLWNDAADYAINPILEDAGLELPDGVLNDPQFRGMSAEQIYDALERLWDDVQRGGKPPGEPTCQQTSAGNDDTGRGNSHKEVPGNGNAESDISDKVGAVWDAPDPAQQEAEWQVAVKQAMQVAHMMGRLPGDLAIAVEEASKPRVDWRTLLRRFVQQYASADYSWRRPNRRYTARGLYLPEIRCEAMPGIVVVVDSSRSTLSVLPVFKAELQSIVDECQPEFTLVIMADAAVQRTDRFERGDPIEFNVKGLGGTDFRPVFEYVEREHLDPACLIYLTDGWGSYPELPSDFPTLWALTTADVEVPWGESVVIDDTLASS